MATVETIKGYALRVSQAQSLAELGKVYADMVGYDPYQEDPDSWSGVGELAELANEYILEWCLESGVHCADVFPSYPFNLNP